MPLLLTALASSPEAAPQQGDAAPRNAASIVTSAPVPDFSIGAAYQRALGRHFSVSAQLDYMIPRPGFGHLIGLAETIGVQGWLTRPLHGPWAELTLGVGHTSLRKVPALSQVVVTPGLGAGFTWQFDFGLLVGAGGSLRFPQRAVDSDLVCTRPKMCPATREGIVAAVSVRVGWAW
jgi:hypothetical protein